MVGQYINIDFSKFNETNEGNVCISDKRSLFPFSTSKGYIKRVSPVEISGGTLFM